MPTVTPAQNTYGLGYSSQQIVGLNTIIVPLVLDPVAPIVSHALTGRVTDLTSGDGISGATVQILNPDYTIPTNIETAANTDEDGNYLIVLPVGNYIIAAGYEGYIMSEWKNVTVTNAPVTQDIAIETDPNANYSTVYGFVLDGTNSSAVANAVVNIYDSTDTLVSFTLSADDGEYVLYNLESGNYTLSATKLGYDVGTPISLTVTNPTSEQRNITLTENPDSVAKTILVPVTASDTNLPLKGAWVGLLSYTSGIETLVGEPATTDDRGYAMFANPPAGGYVVKSIK